jgi:5-hydroxyisourate hydrolase-like protein (transthyretin family)
MMPMPRRSFSRFSFLAAVIGLLLVSLAATAQDSSRRGRKYKAPPPTARIEVTVLRDVNGKPIENAAVIFHPMEGEKDKGNMELKTNEDGKTIIDVLPIGDVVRLQIIAKGFQTYGEDYKIDKAEMAVEIRLKRPGEQYSIYKMHPGTADAGKDAPSKDKPAAQPDQPQSQPK